MKPLQTILAILLVSVLSKTTKADYPPDVYAICEITLKSGEVIEGIVQIDKGYACGNHPHGFATRTKRFPQINPRLFEFHGHVGHFEMKFRDDEEVFFIINETYECPETERKLDSTKADLFLLEKSTQNYRYRLTDTLKVYSDLGTDERPLPSSVKSISTNEISSFKWLLEPSRRWTDLIAIRHIEPQTDEELYAIGRSGDWDWPAWLHEIAEQEKANLKLYLKN